MLLYSGLSQPNGKSITGHQAKGIDPRPVSNETNGAYQGTSTGHPPVQRNTQPY
jgi:hypothetical protein